MMIKKSATIALLFAFGVTGCAQGLPGLRPLTYQLPGETRLIERQEDCPNAATDGKQLAPILGVIATAAASKILDNFGTALTEGAKGGALPSSISFTNFEIDENGPPHCIFIIRGSFSPANDKSRALAYPGNANAQLLGLPEVYELQHYVELQLLSSKSGTAMTFAPVMTKIGRSMDGSREGSRELSIALQFSKPGVKETTGGAVLIGNRTIGKDEKYGRPKDSEHFVYESPWFAAIGGQPPATDAPEKSQKPAAPAPAAGTSGGVGVAGSGNAAQAAKKATIPYTVTATIVETRPSNEFLAFVASVFTSAKPTLQTEVKNQFDPATIAAAQNSGFDTQGAYAEALGKAKAAVFDYCSMGTADKISAKLTKSAEVRKLQLAANKAAISADEAQPFDVYAFVTGDDPKTANSAVCS